MCGWIKHTPLCVFVCLFYRHSEDMIVTPFAQVSISNHWCILYFAEERQQVVQLKQCFYALNAANTLWELSFYKPISELSWKNNIFINILNINVLTIYSIYGIYAFSSIFYKTSIAVFIYDRGILSILQCI